jgi:Fe-S-cluster-containing dehydrogenase component
MKAFLINVDICNGCYCCQIACKDEHCGNDWTPYAKPQPLTGQFWGKLNEYVRGHVPHVKYSYVFVPCQHCENAPCIPGCPYGAISARSDGLIIIDPIKCNGCQVCLHPDVCPYGVIYFNQNLQIAQKCTGCAHLVDRNEIFAPRCADNCPIDAIKFGEDSELDLTGTEVLNPEFNTNPRVHYKGLPKRFIAGTVFDSSKQEVVIGATCALSGAGSATATTDDFGDFWLDGLVADDFTLTISASGYTTKTMSVSTKEQDIGLPDIDLA